MLKNIIKSTAICLLMSGFASAVMAVEAQDVVTDKNSNQPIRSEKFGTCVQTKWNAASDPCAVAVKEEPKHAPVVVAPEPAPQPVAKLGREQLTIYFDFNKAVVTAESAAKLDAISDAVNKSPKVTKVNIVGYTDLIGTDVYNNKLSVKRANAVKAYLDTKMRINSNVLGLRGLGKQNPVADCKKTRNRKKDIACMAKDRRVEVEFDFQK